MKNALLALIPFLATLGVVEGQILVTDQPGVTISQDIAMGSTGNTIAVIQFTNRYNEVGNLASFHLFDSTTASKPSFANMKVSIGGTIVGTGTLNNEYSGAEQGYDWIVYTVPHIVIPWSGGSNYLTITADAPSYVTGAVQDNSTHRFQVTMASSVEITGVSNEPLSVLAFAYGVPVRVLRSSLYVSASTDNPTDSTIIFSAGSGGSIILHKLTITFRDERGAPTFLSPDNIFLLGPGGDVVANGYAIKISSENTITWFFNPGLGIFPGSLVSFQLQTPVPLGASIEQATDLVFADGADPAATTGLNLAAQNFPIEISGPTRVR